MSVTNSGLWVRICLGALKGMQGASGEGAGVGRGFGWGVKLCASDGGARRWK
jgi:hypothetical protein